MKAKTCSKCGQSKPTSAYNKNATKKDGFNSACMACQNLKFDAREATKLSAEGANTHMLPDTACIEEPEDIEVSVSEDVYVFLKQMTDSVSDALYRTDRADGKRTCATCQTPKLKTEFGTSRIYRGSASAICRSCEAQVIDIKMQARQARENEALADLEAANWWAENEPKVSRWITEYGIEHVLETLREQGRVRAAALLRATPSWANPRKIAELYAEAYRLTKETGEPYHVDHIVPLLGPKAKYGPFRGERIVMGLHCEANLRVITSSENLSKGNRYWPDMA